MKTVLVTGGNRGIGLEICRQLDELGHKVILCSRDLEKGTKAAGTLSADVIVKQLDVTQEDSIQNLFEFVKADPGKLDVLINNAGLGANSQVSEKSVLSKTKNIMANNFKGVWQMAKKVTPLLRKAGMIDQKEGAGNIPMKSVKHIMETNFYGAWRMIQVFIPLLLKSEDARIINMSSGMGKLENLTGKYPGYSLSKASLNALTIMLANELKGKRIKAVGRPKRKQS